MNKLQLVLKRTFFYPAFLFCSTGFYIMNFRGFEAIATAAAIALAAHVGINGYDMWQQKKADQTALKGR